MPITRRKRRTPLDKAMSAGMRAARKDKLEFERKLSATLSEALKVEVTVKLKRKADSPSATRVKKAGKAATRDYYDLLSSPSAPPAAPELLKRIRSDGFGAGFLG